MSNTTSQVLDAVAILGDRFSLSQSRQQQILLDFLYTRVMVDNYVAGVFALMKANGQLPETATSPNMSFDEFVALYEPFVDPAAECWPEHALKTHCSNGKEWPIKDRISLLAVTADAIVLAEATNAPIPITFTEFIGRLSAAVKAGSFALPVVSNKRTRKKATSAVQTFAPAHDLRCIYAAPVTGDTTGVLQKSFGDSWAFMCDSGELLQDIELANCRAADDLCPEPPDWSYSAAQELVFPEASDWGQALRSTNPLADQPIDHVLDRREVSFGDVRARFSLCNGENGPYVDPELILAENEEVVCDLAPREHSVLGWYLFRHGEARYKVEVVTEPQAPAAVDPPA